MKKTKTYDILKSVSVQAPNRTVMFLAGSWANCMKFQGFRKRPVEMKPSSPRRPRLLCSLTKGLPRSAQLELLQGEVQGLKLQTPDETRQVAMVLLI